MRGFPRVPLIVAPVARACAHAATGRHRRHSLVSGAAGAFTAPFVIGRHERRRGRGHLPAAQTEVTMKPRLAWWKLLFPLLPIAACTGAAPDDPPHIKDPVPF